MCVIRAHHLDTYVLEVVGILLAHGNRVHLSASPLEILGRRRRYIISVAAATSSQSYFYVIWI